MTDWIYDEEKLFRAVLPLDMFIRKDGTLTSAAFKDSQGLSVDRSGFRSDKEVVDAMRKNKFKGRIVSVTAGYCREINSMPLYKPSRSNIYHSEIHKDEKQVRLSSKQCKELARMAETVSNE